MNRRPAQAGAPACAGPTNGNRHDRSDSYDIRARRRFQHSGARCQQERAFSQSAIEGGKHRISIKAHGGFVAVFK